MPLPLLPLAAWLEGLGPLLLVAFWVIRQVMTAIQEQKEQEAAKQGAPPNLNELPPKQVVQRQGGRQQGDRQQEGRQAADVWGEQEDDRRKDERQEPQQGDLRSEVDEFLKRIAQASEGAAGNQQAQAGAPPEEIQRRRQALDPFEEPPRRVAPKQKPKPKPRQKPASEQEIELLTDESSDRPSSPSRRVQKELRHLPESQLAEQAALMGEQISQSDERLDARLHKKFDHKLGKLSRDEEASPVPEVVSETGAQRIKALLARPGGVREAIILGEILRRPSDDPFRP